MLNTIPRVSWWASDKKTDDVQRRIRTKVGDVHEEEKEIDEIAWNILFLHELFHLFAAAFLGYCRDMLISKYLCVIMDKWNRRI